MLGKINCWKENTVYMVYLANNKLRKLEHNAYWHTFSLAERTILSVDCLTNTHNTCNYNAKQKHLGCKKGETNQKQQLSDYTCD